jgi:hypothetical protein
VSVPSPRSPVTIDRIQDDALGAHGFDGGAKADEQPVEAVFTRLGNLGPLDLDLIDY